MTTKTVLDSEKKDAHEHVQENSSCTDVSVMDVAIVGGGIVGAAIACALGEYFTQVGKGQRIALIDNGMLTSESSTRYTRTVSDSFDPRVVALNHASIRFLQSVGVWDVIREHRACAYQHMTVWDGEGTADIQFDSADIHAPYLGYIVENTLVIDALMEKIRTFTCVELLSHTSLKDIAIPDKPTTGVATNDVSDVGVAKLTLNNIVSDKKYSLSASIVIAADGASSFIREHLRFKTREWSYDHRAIVTTVKTEKPHAFTAWQRFTHQGPLAFLPLQTCDGNNHYCSVVWSLDLNVADEKMALSDEEFKTHIARALENRLGRVIDIDKRFAIPLTQRHAVDYIKPHVALVGDAAHTIHPLAGQGVNLGLADAKALVEELQRAIERDVSLTDMSILKRYQRARKTHNLAAMGTMEGFKRLFGATSPWIALARNIGMDVVSQQVWLKKMFIRLARGE